MTTSLSLGRLFDPMWMITSVTCLYFASPFFLISVNYSIRFSTEFSDSLLSGSSLLNVICFSMESPIIFKFRWFSIVFFPVILHHSSFSTISDFHAKFLLDTILETLFLLLFLLLLLFFNIARSLVYVFLAVLQHRHPR